MQLRGAIIIPGNSAVTYGILAPYALRGQVTKVQYRAHRRSVKLVPMAETRPIIAVLDD
jgi:hypothetical protein